MWQRIEWALRDFCGQNISIFESFIIFKNCILEERKNTCKEEKIWRYLDDVSNAYPMQHDEDI